MNVVRRSDVTDAGVVAGLWLRARKAAVPAIPAPVHDDEDVRQWFAEHVLANCEVWLAEEDGRVVGLLVLDGDWVDQLYVEPSETGRGIGAALLDVAKRERPGGLRLWTFEANAGARRFYERHGFVAVERTDGSGNEEGAPDVRYVWEGRAAAP